MAPSTPRFLALLGMIGLSLVVAFVVFYGLVATNAENSVSESEDGQFVGATLAALVATLLALAGLAAGSRVLTGVGILGHFGAAFYIMLVVGIEWLEPDFGFLVYVAVGVLVVDLLATAAALGPPAEAEVVRARPSPAPAAHWQLTAAVGTMSLVALASAAALLLQPADILSPPIGLGGALACILALRTGRGSVAVGCAVVQGMLTVLLFLLFGWATGSGLLHVLVLTADVLTIWAGYLLAPERRP